MFPDAPLASASPPARSSSRWRRRLARLDPTNQFPYHRIRTRLAAWRRIGTGATILRWFQNGVELPLTQDPPPFHRGTTHLDPESRHAWENIVRPHYLQAGAIVPVTHARHVSRAFLIPKDPARTQWRLVIDLRPLNRFLAPLPLKLANLRSLPPHVRPGAHLLMFDIADAFFHVPLSPHASSLCVFSLDGQLYRLPALPFGLASSPFFFQKAMAPLLAFLRNPRAQCPCPPPWMPAAKAIWSLDLPPFVLQYLDDFLLVHEDVPALRRLGLLIPALLEELGVTLRLEKSCLVPVTRRKHLGLLVDLDAQTFGVPPAQLEKLQVVAQKLLTLRHPPVKLILRFTGIANSLCLAIRPTRWYLRHLYNCVKTAQCASTTLTPQAKTELQFWMHLPLALQSTPFAPLPNVFLLHTDASLEGWGATLSDLTRPKEIVCSRGFWTFQERQAHINELELLAVLRALETFRSQLSQRQLHLKTDSQVTMHVLRNLTSRSPRLHSLLGRVLDLILFERITLDLAWLKSSENSLADALSRQQDADDYMLQPALFQHLDRALGPHCIDRFATPENVLVQSGRFNSLWPRSGSEGNAFASATWSETNSWCNPPWSLLPRLTPFFLQFPSLHVSLLVPKWTSAPWWRPLQRLAWLQVFLPAQPQMFVSGRSACALDRPSWDLVLFRLDWPQPWPHLRLDLLPSQFPCLFTQDWVPPSILPPPGLRSPLLTSCPSRAC
ncbi:MAG: hypothetical protein Rubg2KO_41340 [Rubricoccaceae bacterium]